jgi:hypothetical protein
MTRGVVWVGVLVVGGMATWAEGGVPEDPTHDGEPVMDGAPAFGLAGTGVGVKAGSPEDPTHGGKAAMSGAPAFGLTGSALRDGARAEGATGQAGAGGGRREFLGFDRNEYPGDGTLPALRRHFAFAGYWLNAPPGETANGWVGKREVLRAAGFGFALLWNGRVDAKILKAQKAGTRPEAMGAREGAAAVAAARGERFPAGGTIYLDQEEGGRMLPEQAGYLLAWTEAVAKGGFRPGVYGSGQPVGDGPGKTVTTAEDIRAQVKAKRLHEVAMWVYQDACPPAPGCVVQAPALGGSGTVGAEVWQYAQSPRRPESTRACARTYAADGNCYLPELPGMHLDLSVAGTADPSRGR